MDTRTLLIGLVAALGMAALTVAFRIDGFSEPLLLAGLAILAGLVERTGLRFGLAGRASASHLVALAAGIAIGPAAAGLAGLAAGLSGGLFRGRPASRTVFNCGSLTLCGVLAGTVLQAHSSDPTFLVMFGLAASAAVGHVALSGALVVAIVWADAGRAKAILMVQAVARLLPTYGVTGTAGTLLVSAAQPLNADSSLLLVLLLLASIPTIRSVARGVRASASTSAPVVAAVRPTKAA